MKITLRKAGNGGNLYIDVKKSFPYIQTNIDTARTKFREGGKDGNDCAMIVISTIHNNKPEFSWYEVSPMDFLGMKNREEELNIIANKLRKIFVHDIIEHYEKESKK